MNPKVAEFWNMALSKYHEAEKHLKNYDPSTIRKLLKESIIATTFAINAIGKSESDVAVSDMFDFVDEKVRSLLNEALSFLEATKDFGGDTFAKMVDCLKKSSPLKGKAFYFPLRLAFTAKTEGPELKELFPLLGKDLCVKRLKEILQQ